MPEQNEQSRAQQLMGDVAPKLAELTDDVLFADVWERAELSPRDPPPEGLRMCPAREAAQL